jgi:dihydrofolate reductase
MGKVILNIAASVDGFIATADGGVGWLDPFNHGGEDYGFGEFLKTVDVNIQGANTYKQVLGFDIDWPYESVSFVVTNEELDKPEGADIEFHSGDLKKLISNVNSVAKKDIWLIGGAQLTQSLLRESLIDEMIISVMPVLLGSGISLFGATEIPVELTLLKSQDYGSGVVQVHYSTRH